MQLMGVWAKDIFLLVQGFGGAIQAHQNGTYIPEEWQRCICYATDDTIWNTVYVFKRYSVISFQPKQWTIPTLAQPAWVQASRSCLTWFCHNLNRCGITDNMGGNPTPPCIEQVHKGKAQILPEGIPRKGRNEAKHRIRKPFQVCSRYLQ